jgi:tetratricopeptide (TPR) repeat protein
MCNDSNKSPRVALFTNLNEHRKTLLMVLALVALTFALFAPAIRFQFINYDDNVYVYDNPHVLRGLSLTGLRYAFTTIDQGNWMPLTWLSFQLDATLSGRWPAGYHFTAIMLHCGSAAFLFLALQRMTKCFWRSAFVAVLFAVHPLRQESVVWIAERKGTLSTFLWMLGLLLYARYAEKRTVARYSAVAICLALGLMAKAMLITFPFALLLLDFWPLKRLSGLQFRVSSLRVLLEKIPLLMICVAMAAITFWTQDQAGAIGSPHHPIHEKLLHVLADYVFYLQKLFWPVALALPYAQQPVALIDAIAAGVFVISASVFAFMLRRQAPWLTTGWFWYLGTFTPVIGLIQISHVFVADRYTYVPFAGIALIVAWGMGSIAEKFSAARKPIIAAATAICLLTAMANQATLFRWSNPVTLFTDSIRKGPHAVACNNLAIALNDRGEYGAAISYSDMAIALEPQSPGAYITRGLSYLGLENYKHAIAADTNAVELDESSANAGNNRSNAYTGKDDLDKALAAFSRAIELGPDLTEAWNNRAFVWFCKSNYTAAIADCTRAIEINPGNSRAYNNRGNVFCATGDSQRAVEDYSRAIALDPLFATAYTNRATAFGALKAYDKARADIDKFKELTSQPDVHTVRVLSENVGPK